MEIAIADRNSTPTIRRRYDVTIRGRTISTTVTDRADAVDDWIGDIVSRRGGRRGPPGLIVGLDVEYRRSTVFVPGRIAVLQLCADSRCLVYQIFHSGGFLPARLADFLSPRNDFTTFVGVDIRAQLARLGADYGIGRYARCVDLAEFAAEMCDDVGEDLADVGLGELGEKVLGEVVIKPAGMVMSRWQDPVLTEQQVLCACVDAYMSWEIGKRLGADLLYGY